MSGRPLNNSSGSFTPGWQVNDILTSDCPVSHCCIWPALDKSGTLVGSGRPSGAAAGIRQHSEELLVSVLTVAAGAGGFLALVSRSSSAAASERITAALSVGIKVKSPFCSDYLDTQIIMLLSPIRSPQSPDYLINLV